MATGIFKTVNGQKVELTAKQIKNFIMQVNRWTSEEYNKQRYIMKNKLRTYEAFTGQEKPQSPVKLMYFEARAKQRAGADYKPSMKMQQIKGFQSLGSAKAISKAQQSKKVTEKWQQKYNAYVNRRFSGLIENNVTAKRIYDEITDPVKREKALSDFADTLHLKMDETLKVEQAQAIPFGETFGSSDEFDFDISQYQ